MTTDSQHRILVIEDDPHVQTVMTLLLRRGGFATQVCGDGHQGLDAAIEDQPDLVILDLGLPGLTGTNVLERLRNVSSVPVLVVSSRTNEMEKVRHLSAGADDYVDKPFGSAELLARVNALLRRSLKPDAPVLELCDGEVRLDLHKQQAYVHGAPVDLTRTEFALLARLIREPDRAVDHNELLREAWHDVSGCGTDRIKFTATRLRKKLGPETGQRLRSVHGVGYRWRSAAGATGDN